MLLLAAVALPLASCGGDKDDDDDVKHEESPFSDNTQPGSGNMNANAGAFTKDSETKYLISAQFQTEEIVSKTPSVYTIKDEDNMSFLYDSSMKLRKIITENGNGTTDFDFSNPNRIKITMEGGYPLTLGLSYNNKGYVSRITSDYTIPVADEDGGKTVGTMNVKATVDFTYNSDENLTSIVFVEDDISEAKTEHNEDRLTLTWTSGMLRNVLIQDKQSTIYKGGGFTETSQEHSWTAKTDNPRTNPSRQWEGVNFLPLKNFSLAHLFFINLLGKGSNKIPSGWSYKYKSNDGEGTVNDATINSGRNLANSWLVTSSYSSYKDLKSFSTKTVFNYKSASKAPRRTAAESSHHARKSLDTKPFSLLRRTK